MPSTARPCSRPRRPATAPSPLVLLIGAALLACGCASIRHPHRAPAAPCTAAGPGRDAAADAKRTPPAGTRPPSAARAEPASPIDPADRAAAGGPDASLPGRRLTPGMIERAKRLDPDFDAEAFASGVMPPPEHVTSLEYDPPSKPSLSGVDSGLNIRVNQDSSGRDQNETTLAVNPANPLNLVAGANDYRTGSVKSGFYSSLDGGATWADGVLPETTYPYQGDPAVTFCGDGSAIFLSLSFTGSFQPDALFAYKSTDGGRTWPQKTTVVNHPTGIPFADKEWVNCDKTGGTFKNRVYASWTDFGFSGTPILFRYSSDGANTWSTSIRVSDGGSTQGSNIAIGPAGEVYVAWEDSSSGARVGFDRSTNGGATFGTDKFPSTVVDIPGDPVFRRNSFPSMDVDLTNGATRGFIYIVWSDNRNGDPDILLVRSTDGGNTWSAPVRVNDDALHNGADQWFPWIKVDPLGRVIVTFFDRRQNPGGRLYDIWGAISRDGGVTFDTNFLITDTRSNGSLNGFIGDYSALTATSDRLYPLWTDLRAGTGESDIYTDRFANTFRYDEVQNQRFTDKTTMTFDTEDARFGQVLHYDVARGLVSSLVSTGGFSAAACFLDNLPAPPLHDAGAPPPGDAFWYLVRANGPDGVGTYGDGSPSRPNPRDVLDDPGVCAP